MSISNTSQFQLRLNSQPTHLSSAPLKVDQYNIPQPQVKEENLQVAESLINAGKEHEQKGEYDAAEKIYRMAIQETSKSEYYSHLPKLFELKKENERASLAYNILADLQNGEEKYKEVIDSLKKSLELFPCISTKEKLAVALKDNGRAKEAGSHFLELAQEELSLENKLKAYNHARKVIELSPEQVEGWKILSTEPAGISDQIKHLLKGANQVTMSMKDRKHLCKLILNKDPENREAQFILQSLSLLKLKNIVLELQKQIPEASQNEGKINDLINRVSKLECLPKKFTDLGACINQTNEELRKKINELSKANSQIQTLQKQVKELSSKVIQIETLESRVVELEKRASENKEAEKKIVQTNEIEKKIRELGEGDEVEFLSFLHGLGKQPIKNKCCFRELTVIKELDKSHIALDVKNASKLALALQKNSSIRSVKLSHSYLPYSGVLALALVIENHKTITRLELSNMRWESNNQVSIIALAKALEKNSSITQVILTTDYTTGPKIDSEGALALARIIQSNSSIVELYLSGSTIQDEGVKILLQALQKNSSIKKLGFASNECSAPVRELLQKDDRTKG